MPQTNIPLPEAVTAAELINIVDNNAKRSLHLSRDRNHDPYTNEEMLKMFAPYLRDFSHEGDLGPREARLLETWFRDFRTVFSLERANTEYDAELSRERNLGFELRKENDSLLQQNANLKQQITVRLNTINNFAGSSERLKDRVAELEGYLAKADEKNREHKNELAQMHEQRRSNAQVIEKLEKEIGALNALLKYAREMLGAAERRIEDLTGEPHSSISTFRKLYEGAEREMVRLFELSKKPKVAKDARLSNIVVQP